MLSVPFFAPSEKGKRMLRDEADRLVGAARGEVIPFPVQAPLRDIEKAWIHTCQQVETRRQLRPLDFPMGSLEQIVLSALARCDTAGAITSAHLGVMTMHGNRGRPPNVACEIAYRLWVEAMAALADEAKLGGFAG
jgi:hypothetical protein